MSGERAFRHARSQCVSTQYSILLASLFPPLYQVSPTVFGLWMRVLRHVPQATLTVLALPEDARPYLTRVTQQSLGEVRRLTFVDYLSRKEHLARASLATAFLDTLLVNAHTTAMDVLWAGLPLVTTPDTRFASRVASSILLAALCPHTLARSHEDYVQVAVRLSTSPSAARRARLCLSQARGSGYAEGEEEDEVLGGGEEDAEDDEKEDDDGEEEKGEERQVKRRVRAPLFDTSGWVVGLERLLGKLWDMHALGHTFHLASSSLS